MNTQSHAKKNQSETLQIKIEEISWRTRQIQSELTMLVKWSTNETFPNAWGLSKAEVTEGVKSRQETLCRLNREIVALCAKNAALIQKQLKASIVLTRAESVTNQRSKIWNHWA